MTAALEKGGIIIQFGEQFLRWMMVSSRVSLPSPVQFQLQHRGAAYRSRSARNLKHNAERIAGNAASLPQRDRAVSSSHITFAMSIVHSDFRASKNSSIFPAPETLGHAGRGGCAPLLTSLFDP
jgi:hypothetical protein